MAAGAGVCRAALPVKDKLFHSFVNSRWQLRRRATDCMVGAGLLVPYLLHLQRTSYTLSME